MIELTDTQRQALAATSPPCLVDPQTMETYVLVRADVYQRLAGLLTEPQKPLEIPTGIRRSQEAFWRDLPDLLTNRKNHGKWVGYHLEERLGIARDGITILHEINRRGIADDAYYLSAIHPREVPPWEPEDIEALAPQHLEDL